MLYAHPHTAGAKLAYKPQYDNFIGGRFVAPVEGQYFDVVTPINGQVYTRAARSGPRDIELALDAAHAATAKWAATPAAERAGVLLKIADRIEQNLELLAYAERCLGMQRDRSSGRYLGIGLLRPSRAGP
jgi:aldehyde dehydrogenase